MVSRRKLLKAGSAGLLSSLISPWSFAQTAPALLQGTRQRQFSRLMPNPLDPANLFAPDSFLGTAYTLRIREFQAALGLTDPATIVAAIAKAARVPEAAVRRAVMLAGWPAAVAPVALAVPRRIRKLQVEGFRQRAGDPRRLRFKGIEGARRAAKLQHQHPRTHLPQTLLPA